MGHHHKVSEHNLTEQTNRRSPSHDKFEKLKDKNFGVTYKKNHKKNLSETSR